MQKPWVNHVKPSKSHLKPRKPGPKGLDPAAFRGPEQRGALCPRADALGGAGGGRDDPLPFLPHCGGLQLQPAPETQALKA